MSDNKHCIFGPSALSRIDLCPGSATLCEGAPEETSEAAERGTRIHAMAADLLLSNHLDGLAAQDELDAATAIHEYARPLMETGEVHVEQRLEYSTIDGVLYWGTSDLVVVRPEDVLICDWKTGFRPVEEAENNLQGAAYALAAMQTYGRDRAEVRFYNPCCRQETVATFSDASALASEIERVIARAKEERPAFNPSEDACRYCAAKPFCAAHMATAESCCNIAEGKRQDVTEWSDAALTLWYDRLTLASKLLETIVKPELMRRASAGWSGPYVVREQSGGRSARDICKAAVAVSDVLTQAEILECCALSVTQLRDAFAAKAVGKGLAKTKKEGCQLFETETQGCFEDKEPRRVIARRRD